MLPKAVPKFFALIQDQTSFGLREQFDAIVLSIPFTIATYLITTEKNKDIRTMVLNFFKILNILIVLTSQIGLGWQKLIIIRQILKYQQI